MVLTIALVLILGATVNALPFEGYVVGGSNAVNGEFPYVVSLRSSKSHICGGSILDSTRILTAAHCVYQTNSSLLSVQYGNVVLNRDDPKAIAVASVDIHPQYTPGGQPLYKNDVAVLRLASAITFSTNAKVTKMPRQGTATPGNSPAVLVGWGYNTTGGSVMNTLQKVTITCYTDAACSSVHGANVNSQYHICAGVPAGGKGQCSGDSGGPLTVNGVQRGTVSWSVKPCTVAPYPGVYANVAKYSDWICSKATCTFG